MFFFVKFYHSVSVTGKDTCKMWCPILQWTHMWFYLPVMKNEWIGIIANAFTCQLNELSFGVYTTDFLRTFLQMCLLGLTSAVLWVDGYFEFHALLCCFVLLLLCPFKIVHMNNDFQSNNREWVWIISLPFYFMFWYLTQHILVS